MKGLSINKSLLLVGALAGLILAIGLLPQGTAKADRSVPTSAEIIPSCTGCAPTIEWKWELPDMDSNTAGIQYGTPTNAHQHDDDIARSPATPPASHQMMQVAPNLEDLPEVRQIEYWVAVEDPNGIADIASVWVDVYHPDETLKYQLYLQPVTCDALGDKNTVGTPLEAAVHTGQMTATEADNIVYQCGQLMKKVYHGVGTISKHQMCGEYPNPDYRVEARATDQAGNASRPLINWFDVLCVTGLEVDFNQVNWGLISPNVTKWLPGDLVWDVPPDNKPTVKNTGNHAMYLWLNFSKMVGASLHKEITSFDGMFFGQLIDPIVGTASPPNPAEAVCFNTGLGSNEIQKLDLSIHPGSIPADVYTGTLSLWGSLSCP